MPYQKPKVRAYGAARPLKSSAADEPNGDDAERLPEVDPQILNPVVHQAIDAPQWKANSACPKAFLRCLLGNYTVWVEA